MQYKIIGFITIFLGAITFSIWWLTGAYLPVSCVSTGMMDSLSLNKTRYQLTASIDAIDSDFVSAVKVRRLFDTSFGDISIPIAKKRVNVTEKACFSLKRGDYILEPSLTEKALQESFYSAGFEVHLNKDMEVQVYAIQAI